MSTNGALGALDVSRVLGALGVNLVRVGLMMIRRVRFGVGATTEL